MIVGTKVRIKDIDNPMPVSFDFQPNNLNGQTGEIVKVEGDSYQVLLDDHDCWPIRSPFFASKNLEVIDYPFSTNSGFAGTVCGASTLKIDADHPVRRLRGKYTIEIAVDPSVFPDGLKIGQDVMIQGVFDDSTS